jgi:YesN/AraC family two-component response regulator
MGSTSLRNAGPFPNQYTGATVENMFCFLLQKSHGKHESILNGLLNRVMKVFIKNMVCTRCQLFVKAQLEALGLPYNHVEIGHADIQDPVTPAQLAALNECLKKAGLELTQDGNEVLVDKIKAAVMEVIQRVEPLTLKFSEFLARKLNYEYAYLSHLFVANQGITLEHYLISRKIDKVKELLMQEGLTLTEIAYRMYYCSVQHLSSQFKKVTGLTPSQFKRKIGGRFQTLHTN